MSVITRWYVGPGVEGPVPTTRSRALQEALQDMEARMFVEGALLDPERKRRLGPNLAARVQALCDDRTRHFGYLSGPYRAAMRNLVGYCAADTDCTARGLPEGWAELESRLYRLAGEVAQTLKSGPP
jgi:hypothetical protein